MKKKKIAIVVASVLQVKFFLIPHLNRLSEIYDVTLILNNDHPEILASIDLPITIIQVPIRRKVSIWHDLCALYALTNLFLKQDFDLVHTMNPKAGLLGIVAAWFARVKIRVHTFQGEFWVNKEGLARYFFLSLDKLVGFLATNLLVVSASERDFLIAEGVVSPKKSIVLANGSIGGVDLEKFKPNWEIRNSIRVNLSISEQAILFLYMGRLTREKGLVELIEAFPLFPDDAQVFLLLVGPDEDGIIEEYSKLIESPNTRIRIAPYTASPESYMAASDILVLPSHREGFGVVIIEAAAMGVPAIGSNIYGISDAVQNEVTGFLFEKENVADLFEKMQQLAGNPFLRSSMGVAAALRVKKYFDQKIVIQSFFDYYKLLIK